MGLAQVAIAACFLPPIMFFLGVACYGLKSSIAGEMANASGEAEAGNVAKFIVALASLLIAALLIFLCAAAVRWLA